MPRQPASAEPWIDRLAKRFAGRSSRRVALSRAGAGLLGGLLASLLPRSFADALGRPNESAVDDCPPGSVAVNGVCYGYPRNPCSQGLTECGGQCVNILLDPNHCGGCGTQCPYGIPCSYGACTIEVTPPCANILVDPNNCGACGHACPVPSNSIATCSNGSCGAVCAAGFRLCNGVCIPSNACCTSADCAAGATCINGACTAAPCVPSPTFCCTPADCPAGPRSATVTCSNGLCGHVCPPLIGGNTSPTDTEPPTSALADLVHLPAADGESSQPLGTSCCISTDCITGGVCLNGSCFCLDPEAGCCLLDGVACSPVVPCCVPFVCLNGTCGLDCVPIFETCTPTGLPCCGGFCSSGLCLPG